MIRLTGIGRLVDASGVVPDAEVHLARGRIVYAGPRSEAPPVRAERTYRCAGRLVTPGLIDAHTHPRYAAPRLGEAAGGGILASVQATRAAPPEALVAGLAARLRRWVAGGATTVEAKTGYDLTREGELRAVADLRGLDAAPGLPRVAVTFLAAHAVPAEFAGASGRYARECASWCAAAAAAGAEAVDVFCDTGYFSVPQARVVLAAGRAAGLATKVHAEELAHTGAALLAAQQRVLSADHLLRASDADARALAAAGVVGVLCPMTALRLARRPPVAALRAAGVPLALGSDHNPGTAGSTDMSLVVALAVATLGMSVTEALTAATAGGAAALGRAGDRGRLAPGMLADLVEWDADHEDAFAWGFGLQPVRVFRGGEQLVGPEAPVLSDARTPVRGRYARAERRPPPRVQRRGR